MCAPRRHTTPPNWSERGLPGQLIGECDMPACPKCNNNAADNRQLNFCTVCDAPHADIVCGKCGNRWNYPINLKEKSDDEKTESDV